MSASLLGLLLFSLPGIASDPYFGIGGGITYAPNERISATDTLLDYDIGVRVGTLVYGRRFEDGWQAELEVSYRRNELELVTFDNGQIVIQGDNQDAVQALSFMGNFSYEFDLELPVKPYVGAGLGVTNVFYDIIEIKNPVKILDDEAVTMAYQFYLGLLVPVGERWQIAADYRWWETLEFDMTTGTGDSVSLDYSTRAFSLSFRRLLDGSQNTVGAPIPRETSRWYLDGRIGTSIAADADIDNRFNTNFDGFDLGVAGTFALGYSYVRPSGRRWRAEVELLGWSNDADVIDFGLGGESPLAGSVGVLGASANLLYDFAPSWKIRPYAGFGVGYAEVDYDISLSTNGEFAQYVKDSHTGGTVQALLGFGIRLTAQTEISLNYRYWLAPSVKLEDPEGLPIETEHGGHLLMLGFRFGF